MENKDKFVYFVRHGESEGNAEGLWQTPDMPLSPHGFRQADVLAQRFSSLDIDIIWSSTYLRARQTAEAINKIAQKEIVYDDLLGEHKRPSQIAGKSAKDEEAQKIYDIVWSHRFDPKFRYADEENVSDRMQRGGRVAQKLLASKEDRILVVSHSGIIRSTLLFILHGEHLTPEMYWSIFPFFHLDNTGISILRYKNEKQRWQLLAWNDIAHLG